MTLLIHKSLRWLIAAIIIFVVKMLHEISKNTRNFSPPPNFLITTKFQKQTLKKSCQKDLLGQ